jgi:hypothetical protein
VPPPDGFVAKPIDPEEMLALAKKLTSGTRDKTATIGSIN